VEPDDKKSGKPTREVTLAPRPSNVCVCFHVPLGKIIKHVRLNKPRVASQISECYGAGTGCGWCIPFLEQVFEAMKKDPTVDPAILMSEEEYLARRREYHRKINWQKMKDERDTETKT
jgi:bacterioferritin-associated ferredoxin